ncbi:hypothetical protein C8T65DRAFT_745335 [Cerioporus squamosus]|nr:hypothetical protein C8T65DRAFT_745335 [Cerioporus squamosus]
MAALAKLFTYALVLIQALDSGSKKDLLPHVPVQLRASTRWLQATVVNNTPYSIKVEGSYFDSGEYYKAPQDISPQSQMTFSCRNTSLLKGCAGATKFEADIEGSEHLGFIIGWTNSFEGSCKVSAVADYHPTKMGYDRADDRACTATSEYGACYVDEAEVLVKAKCAKLKITAKPHGWEPVYVVEHFVEEIRREED